MKGGRAWEAQIQGDARGACARRRKDDGHTREDEGAGSIQIRRACAVLCVSTPVLFRDLPKKEGERLTKPS